MTASAEVSIIDTAALDEAFEQAQANGLMIGWSTDTDVEDPTPSDAGAEPGTRALDQLAWLIWPTDGMETLEEAGAFLVYSVESAVVEESADRGTATWSVTAKLRNVDQLRRLATEAHPDEAKIINDSLAVAWQCAADPFAPLRPIPGIDWQPVSVAVEHLPARPAARERR